MDEWLKKKGFAVEKLVIGERYTLSLDTTTLVTVMHWDQKWLNGSVPKDDIGSVWTCSISVGIEIANAHGSTSKEVVCQALEKADEWFDKTREALKTALKNEHLHLDLKSYYQRCNERRNEE